MRLAAWIAIALLTLSVLLGVLGRNLEQETLQIFSGLSLLAAAAAAILTIPAVANVRDRIPAMPGLFQPLAGRRWCATCGNPAPPEAICPICTSPPRAARNTRSKIPRVRDNR